MQYVLVVAKTMIHTIHYRVKVKSSENFDQRECDLLSLILDHTAHVYTLYEACQ